jgi:membrane associated rhomboid family serine protease
MKATMRAARSPRIVVLTLVLALTVTQSLIIFGPGELGQTLIQRFAFIPGRITFQIAPVAVMRDALRVVSSDISLETRLALVVLESRWAWTTPITYIFLHESWTHLLVNCCLLLLSGVPLADRIGAPRFLLLFGACAVAGAFIHLLAHPFDARPVIGASAAISGTMGAMTCIGFRLGSTASDNQPGKRRTDAASLETHRRPLSSNWRRPLFVATWILINALPGAFPEKEGSAPMIAWEAHIGGFLAGLALFIVIDPRRRVEVRRAH